MAQGISPRAHALGHMPQRICPRVYAPGPGRGWAGRLIPAKYRLIPTKYRLIPTKYRLMPTKYRRIPTKYRITPTKYRLIPTKYKKRHAFRGQLGSRDFPQKYGLPDCSGRPRTEPETVARGCSRELFTANRCEPETVWIFVNRKRHEPEPDLFIA